MKRLVKIVKWIFFITLFLLIGLAALFYIKRDEVIALVVNEASKQLTAPVEVGEVSISFTKFPSAAIHLNEVFTAGNPEVGGDTLLYAQSVFLQFDFWHLLTGDIIIDQISAENGTVNIIRNRQNQYNYQIWKAPEEESDERLFAIKRLILHRVRSSYTDELNAVQVKANIQEADAQGEFTGSIAFNTRLTADLQQVSLDEEAYFREKIALSGEFTTQYINNELELNGPSIGINGTSTLAFTYHYLEEKGKLLAWAADQDIAPIWQFALQQGFVNNRNYRFDGSISAELSLLTGPDENLLDLSFNSPDLSVHIPGYTNLNKLSLDGIYTLKEGLSSLEISKLALDEGKDFLNLKALINDLDHPQISGSLKASLPVADWIALLPLDTLNNGKGRAQMDFNFSGKFARIDNISKSELKAIRLSGDLSFEQGGFDFKNSGRSVEKIDGELALKDDNLIIKRLFFSRGESDIYMQGRFENVLNFLYFENEKLAVRTQVKSQEIVLDEFISDREGSGAYDLSPLNNLDLRLDLEIDRLSFGNFRSRNIKGQLSIYQGEISANNISLQADGGHYRGDFFINPLRENGYELKAFLESKGISMHSVFTSFSNFGQEAITAQNLQGQASGNANFTANMSKALEIDPASIKLIANVEITDGRLKNYEPLKALSRFAELKELEDVAFSKLANTITIENEVINIPEMAINSSVLNLELKGTHDFENNIDYIVRLKLSDILFSRRKAKPKKSEFDEHLAVVEKRDEHVIPVAISGTVDDPKISISGQGFAESIGDDLKKQGEQLKQLFKKDKPAEKKEGNGIIFEWDEG